MKIFERLKNWWKNRRASKTAKLVSNDRMSDHRMMEEAIMRAYRSKQIVVANRQDDGTVEIYYGGPGPKDRGGNGH